jgi:hypothetical protein
VHRFIISREQILSAAPLLLEVAGQRLPVLTLYPKISLNVFSKSLMRYLQTGNNKKDMENLELL